MSYAKKTLLPEEKILFYTKPHYIVFFSMFLWLAFFLWVATSGFGSTLFGLFLLLLSILNCINVLINYYCSEYVITNKRIIMKVGFIRRKSLELFLERLEGIYVEQSIIGRVLNYGTVVVGGIGGTQNPFFYIPNPIEFRNSVLLTQTKK